VDDEAVLQCLMTHLGELSEDAPVIFPMHPHASRLSDDNWKRPRLHVTEPMGYLEFAWTRAGREASW